MCGIAGIVLPIGQRATRRRILAAAQTQSHRGPDALGIHTRENVALAHNRLAIVDPTPAGRQPFADDRYALVCNGEIYNYRELRSELAGLGIVPRGGSDSEVLFHYLKAFGVARTLQASRGMFAFAFCDLAERVTYLCRDRFGIKPLVYTVARDALCFASEIKALQAMTAVRPNPVLALAALAVGELAFVGDRTPFARVRQVPPGSFVTYRPDAPPTVTSYFELAHEVDQAYFEALNAMPVGAVLQELRRLVDASVGSMLSGDVQVGALVSGGVDSSLVASVAAALHPSVSLFTANVVGRSSELRHAQALAEHLRLPLHAARFLPDAILSDWAQLTHHYECPVLYHPNAFPLAAVCRLVRANGVKVVLAGEGADELFLGYPPLLAQLARAEAGGRRPLHSGPPGLAYAPRRGKPRRSVVDDLLVSAATPGSPQRARAAFGFLPRAEARAQGLTIELFGGHLSTLLHRNDRMGMLASVEARFPYLDERLVRFGVNLPVKWKVALSDRVHDSRHRDVVDKWLLRRAAEARLPPRLAWRRKWGFKVRGLALVRLAPAFFAGGYVSSVLELSSSELAHAVAARAPADVARLASVDVFGRIFGLGESVDAVTERLIEHGACMIGA